MKNCVIGEMRGSGVQLYCGEMRNEKCSVMDIESEGVAALKRLIKLGRGDSSGQTRVANFLLSWWDAHAMGGWDVRNAGCLEKEIVEDMISVIRLIERRNCHPSDFGLQKDFLEIARRHRNVE